jgi:transcriptional regulator with GAF, ATPase, and Fis domain
MPDDTHIDLRETVAALRQQLEARTAERDEALAREAALAEVLHTLNSSPGDLTPVFDAILEKAHALCGVEHGALVTYDGEYFRVAAEHGMPQSWIKQHRQPYRGTDLHERLLRGERYAQVADARAAAENPQRRVAVRAGSRTILMVPLRKEGALLGAITAHRREVRPFSDNEIARLENFAAQAVIAIENAWLLGELQARTRDLEESLEYQTATGEVLNVISRSTADVQPVLDTVVQTAVRLCGADTGTIAIREGEVYRFVSSSYSAAERPCASGPLSPVATPWPGEWRSKAGSCISRTSAPTRSTWRPRL